VPSNTRARCARRFVLMTRRVSAPRRTLFFFRLLRRVAKKCRTRYRLSRRPDAGKSDGPRLTVKVRHADRTGPDDNRRSARKPGKRFVEPFNVPVRTERKYSSHVIAVFTRARPYLYTTTHDDDDDDDDDDPCDASRCFRARERAHCRDCPSNPETPSRV